MKKMIFVGLILTFLIATNFVKADVVNMNISVNGTSNLNITVDADDTLARQMINETQTDTYGTMTGSGTKDVILNEIKNGAGNPISGTEGLNSMNEICVDPFLKQYLSQIGDLPPLGFVSYLKSLGYDDEAHINIIWTMCQQLYINQNEGVWSQDLNGMQQDDLVSVFAAAIGWLNGNGNSVYAKAKELAMILDSYFASDKDVWIMTNKIKQLELRIEALERTIEETNPEEYCNSKLDMMKLYNLTSVKCGENSTTYWNAKKEGFDNYETIAYADCEEDWICTKWSDCENGKQTRKCVDKNACGTFYNKPTETIGCAMSLQQLIEAPTSKLTNSASKVESSLSIEQLLENYLPFLFLICISIPIALIVIGIKKDHERKRRQ